MSIFQQPFARNLAVSQRNSLPRSIPEKTLLCYASFVITACLLPVWARHDEKSDCISVSSRSLDSVFGRNGFKRINAEVGWIDTEALSSGGGYHFCKSGRGGATRAYKITTSGLDAVWGAINDGLGDEFISKQSAATKNHGRTLQSTTSTSAHALGRFEMPLRIRLARSELLKVSDEVALLSSANEMLKPSKRLEPLAERLASMTPRERLHTLVRYRLTTLLMLDLCRPLNKRESKGVIQRYTQSEAGRWYGKSDGLSLQNVPRELRAAAFKGNYLIDIDNCHYALLAQMADRVGLSTPCINELLRDKKQFRAAIASEVHANTRIIKEALIALLFGAKLNGARSSLNELFRPHQLERFRSSVAVKSLASEISACSPVVVNSYREKSKKAGALVNDLGKSVTASSKDLKQSIAFLLQGAEAQILSAVGTKYGKHMRLLLHDGFISSRRLNESDLAAYVLQTTSWQVTFSQEQL